MSLMKGVEKATGMRMSEVIAEVLPLDESQIAVISGPNLALEIAKEQPTAAVVSSTSLETAQSVASVARNRYFRSFVNTDVIGTEFGGVLKNLIAVAIGIVDGVGYGENTKASIITRGLVEMTDFAVAYGAHPETLSGLAGLGDLIATCAVAALAQQHGRPAARAGLPPQRRGEPDEADRPRGSHRSRRSSNSRARRASRCRSSSRSRQVLAGTLDPRDIAPHLTTDDEPQGERTMDGQAQGGSAVRRAFKRALDQLRNGGRSARGDRP